MAGMPPADDPTSQQSGQFDREPTGGLRIDENPKVGGQIFRQPPEAF